MATTKRGELNGVPATGWVRNTIARMNLQGSTRRADWARLWLQSYRELGGRSDSSGNKGCPRAAAYGLWLLGRVRDSGRPRQNWPVPQIVKELGKNAAYAVIAADLCASGFVGSAKEIWEAARDEFRKQAHQEPAASEQDEVKLTMILFSESQLN